VLWYDVRALAESTEQMMWMADATCRKPAHAGIDWFPVAKDDLALGAKAVCGACRVRDECLAFAIKHNERGVWGGTTERERKALVQRPRPKAG